MQSNWPSLLSSF